MKYLVSVIFLASALQGIAQEKKIYLNFFSGVSSIKTHVTQIEGTGFETATLFSNAPTGISLSAELIKNTFIDISFGMHSLRNDHLKVHGIKVSRYTVEARNFGLKLKYEVNLPKSFKIIPFIGYSYSFLDQPVGTSMPFKQRSSSSFSSTVDGVLVSSSSRSVYSSTEFTRNTFSGLSLGGELAYDFKNNLGLYLAYTFFL